LVKQKVMTQLTLKNHIDEKQLSVLLYLLHSWNVETEVVQQNSRRVVSSNSLPLLAGRKKTDDPFSEVWGIWADRDDVDEKILRSKAWKIKE
jgi:hypothetical protein